MNILHVNTYGSGGAAQAAIRLHEGLLKLGLSSAFLTLFTSERDIVYQEAFVDLPLTLTQRLSKGLSYRKQTYQKRRVLKNQINNTTKFSFPFSAYDITLHPLYQWADIINLHWTADFLDYDSFFKKNTKPVVWTLHDMSPFTGGCHYAGTCQLYQTRCENCPQLVGVKNPAYSRVNLASKMRAFFQKPDLSIVAPSKWLHTAALSSSLFKNKDCYWIPYGLNSEIFKPREKSTCREILGLPIDKKMLLFVSDSIQDIRKGYTILLKALTLLKDYEDLFVCAVGKKGGIAHNSLSFEYYELGSINTEAQMSIIYAAADVFIVPSLEDNLPNTVLESLMCGTPVIGFPVGGIPDMIRPEINGLLSISVSAEALATAIQLFFNNQVSFIKDIIRGDAVTRYDLLVQASTYQNLYTKLLY